MFSLLRTGRGADSYYASFTKFLTPNQAVYRHQPFFSFPHYLYGFAFFFPPPPPQKNFFLLEGPRRRQLERVGYLCSCLVHPCSVHTFGPSDFLVRSLNLQAPLLHFTLKVRLRSVVQCSRYTLWAYLSPPCKKRRFGLV